jgi:TonB-linked SusC/RagA family outer membrane protein
MKKKLNYYDASATHSNWYQLLLTMKITIFFCLIGIANLYAGPGYSQSTKISLDMKDAAIESVLNRIEEESEFYFLFNHKLIDVSRKVDILAESKSIKAILGEIFPENVRFIVSDRQIVLVPEEQSGDLESIFQRQVTGTVTDEKGKPLPGVTILVKGSTTGTITDAAGKYQLQNVPTGTILVISFVGMTAQEIPVGNSSVIDVILKEEAVGLDEVVVVGYGTQKKVNLTGAVTALNAEALTRKQVSQSSMILQGLVPGVTVTQRSGQPGQDAGTIMIRGLTTLGDNSPLILVDGIEMGINNIDPAMIESISVLKDAASSSIYGSRAANGVILVTTKRAQYEKMSTTYNSYVGFQDPTDLPDIVGAIDHMTLINEAYMNAGKSPLYPENIIQEYRDNMANDPDRYPDTDWYKEVLTSRGLMQSHFITMMGGTEKIKTAVSLGYLDQDGNMQNTNYKRYTIRFNTDIQLLKKLSAQVDAQYIYANRIQPGRTGNLAIHYTRMIPANQTGILSNGSWGEGWNGDNPIAFTRDGGISKIVSPSNNNEYSI